MCLKCLCSSPCKTGFEITCWRVALDVSVSGVGMKVLSPYDWPCCLCSENVSEMRFQCASFKTVFVCE